MEAEVEAQQDQYDMLAEMTGYEYQYNELTQSWEQVMGENPMTGMPMSSPAPTYDAATGQWMTQEVDPMTGMPVVDPVTGLAAAPVASTDPMIMAAQ